MAPAADDPSRPKPDPRAERLAAALRENLKRRKQQARARQADTGGPDAPSSPVPAADAEPGA